MVVTETGLYMALSCGDPLFLSSGDRFFFELRSSIPEVANSRCRRPPLDQGGWSSESVSHGCIGHDTEADWHQSAPGTPERRLLALEVKLDETQRTD